MTRITALDYNNAYMSAGRITRFLILLLGPVLSHLVLRRLTDQGADFNGLVFALFVMWSPLFFGLPALLMQRERDGALLHEKSTLVRGTKIIPHLLLSPDSTVRPETFASILGWLSLGFMTFEPLVIATVAVVEGFLSFSL